MFPGESWSCWYQLNMLYVVVKWQLMVQVLKSDCAMNYVSHHNCKLRKVKVCCESVIVSETVNQ